MADTNNPALAEDQEVLTTATLDQNASLFFDKMDNFIGSSRLQHTPSLMELPSHKLREIVLETDADDALYGDELKEDEGEFQSVDDDDDDDDNNANAKQQEEEEEVPDSPISRDNGGGGGTGQQPAQAHTRHRDSTPIVRKIDMPPSSHTTTTTATTVASDDTIKTRRRSGGLTALPVTLATTAGVATPSLLRRINDEDAEHCIDIDLSFDPDDDHKQTVAATATATATDIAGNAKLDDADDLSRTLDSDDELWLNVDGATFPECNIRFEEDDWMKDGGKPPAAEFASLRYFFKFVYDRFHLSSQFLLDTSLPIYAEWKKVRKVRIRNASLRTVDYALKACIECVDAIKAVVRNCVVVCVDAQQPLRQVTIAECAEPKMSATQFAVQHLCIIAAWDLFDNGSTPSVNDWSMALSLEHGVAQKLSASSPDLTHLPLEMRSVTSAYHKGMLYKFLMLCEYLNAHPTQFVFGGGPIEWKGIRQAFAQQHSAAHCGKWLEAFDTHRYFINPPLSKLTELMSDKNDKYVSKRKIIAEPVMWLYYMVSFLIERQEKLQNLYMAAMSYVRENKGHKLSPLITNLARQAKEESERLRAIMAKLPGKDDLKQTLIKLVQQRDPQNKLAYTQSLQSYNF
mmetsp:Transcript_18774/g.29868  ORF Transcript_18774/g.29868 Transcript_18774/m.29868 type:complete len:629 (+) Transcript_18774:68-1954(+)